MCMYVTPRFYISRNLTFFNTNIVGLRSILDMKICVNYYAIIDGIPKHKYLFLFVDDLLDKLLGVIFFTTLDLRDGYLHIGRHAARFEKLQQYELIIK